MKIKTEYNAHPFHVELARVFSSVKAMGPPMSDTLVAIISHLFTLEEAHVGMFLSFVYPKTIAQIARKTGGTPESVAPVLEEMIRKRIIIRLANRYMLYPLIPG